MFLELESSGENNIRKLLKTINYEFSSFLAEYAPHFMRRKNKAVIRRKLSLNGQNSRYFCIFYIVYIILFTL